MAKSTSRVFATWLALYELLDAQTWPDHPRTPGSPLRADTVDGVSHSVWFADMDEPRVEAVVVVGAPASDPDHDLATFGSSQSTDEEFTLRVLVGTKVPGCNRPIAFARLLELCDVVQHAVRSPLTGKQAGNFNTTVPNVLWWRPVRVAPQLYMLPENGVGGYAEIDILFHAYI